MIPEIVGEIVNLLSALPTGVLSHVLDFAKALVVGDTEAAKRAATSAATQRIFLAPVKRSHKD